ncbi:MAG: amidohydrolase [Firmicutes bacterium]|nr:amidohydrolase [Bacillota bacterium]
MATLSPLMATMFHATQSLETEIIAMRRYLHMHPETGFDTPATEQFIRDKLQDLQIQVIELKTGIAARIPGRDHGKAVLLRADIDALPITEENDVAYRSLCPGKMHACGHDAHTAMLLGALAVLDQMRGELPVDVYAIFEPAEEGPSPGGALLIVEELQEKGIADKIIAAYGHHVFNDYPAGSIARRYGPVAASTDQFMATVHGKGGHAGAPQTTVDALSIGVKIVNAIESFVSRRTDPFDPVVFSFGKFHAGTAVNIVAEQAELGATVRCHREENRAFLLENARRIAEHICAAYGASCDVQIIRGTPALLNDDRITAYATSLAEQIVGKDHIIDVPHPMMGADDFSRVAATFPATYFNIGTGGNGIPLNNHQPRFNIDESGLLPGTRMFCAFALNADQLSAD